MKNFNDLSISWENGVLYIYEENGSGYECCCNTPEEIGEAIAQYVTIYLEEEV